MLKQMSNYYRAHQPTNTQRSSADVSWLRCYRNRPHYGKNRRDFLWLSLRYTEGQPFCSTGKFSVQENRTPTWHRGAQRHKRDGSDGVTQPYCAAEVRRGVADESSQAGNAQNGEHEGGVARVHV